MKKKIVYLYDEKTKVYMGPIECQPSPLELDKGIYIVPPDSTDIKPPAQKKFEVLVFDKDQWKKVPDYRGVPFWDKKTKELKVIEELGKRPLKNWTNKEPGQDDKWDETADGWIFNQAIFNTNADKKIKDMRMSIFALRKDIEQAKEFKMKDVEDELKVQLDSLDKEIRALATQKK